MSGLVQRLRDRGVCSIAQNSCRNDWVCEEAADTIERLEAENYTLAAGSCDVPNGKIGDEHGNFYCSLLANQRELASVFKEARRWLRHSTECIRLAPDGSGQCTCGMYEILPALDAAIAKVQS